MVDINNFINTRIIFFRNQYQIASLIEIAGYNDKNESRRQRFLKHNDMPGDTRMDEIINVLSQQISKSLSELSMVIKNKTIKYLEWGVLKDFHFDRFDFLKLVE